MDNLTLVSRVDLSKHPLHKSLELPALHSFNNVTDFRRGAAGSNGQHLLNALAKMVDYDIEANNKTKEQYRQWEQVVQNENKKVARLRKERDGFKQQLDDALEDEYP